MMNTAGIVLTAAGSMVGLTAASFGVVQLADERYAQAELVEDLVWSGMKREIRELRREVEAGEASPEDLRELIDKFCRAYPDDRECK